MKLFWMEILVFKPVHQENLLIIQIMSVNFASLIAPLALLLFIAQYVKLIFIFSTNHALILVRMDIGSRIAHSAHYVIVVALFVNLLQSTALLVLNLVQIKHTSIIHFASSLVLMKHFSQLAQIFAQTVIPSVKFAQALQIVNAVLAQLLELIKHFCQELHVIKSVLIKPFQIIQLTNVILVLGIVPAAFPLYNA